MRFTNDFKILCFSAAGFVSFIQSQNDTRNKTQRLLVRMMKSSAQRMNVVSALQLLESGFGLLYGTLPDQIYQKSSWNTETNSTDVEDAYLAPRDRVISYMALALNQIVWENMAKKEAQVFCGWALIAAVSSQVFIDRIYNYFIPGNSVTTLCFDVIDRHDANRNRLHPPAGSGTKQATVNDSDSVSESLVMSTSVPLP